MTKKRDLLDRRVYDILSEKLRQELTNPPPDEGEVFSILDIVVFSIETEENAFLGRIGLSLSQTLLDMLHEMDVAMGQGFLRHFKLVWLGPTFLARLITRSRNLRRDLGKCTNMALVLKRMEIVRFVEHSGGTFSTPVIQKWMDLRSFKISEDDWNKLTV